MKMWLGQLAPWIHDSMAMTSMMMVGFSTNVQLSRNLRQSFTRCLKLHFEKGKKLVRETLARDEVGREVVGLVVAPLTSVKAAADSWNMDDKITPGFCPMNRCTVRDFVNATKNAEEAYIDSTITVPV